MSACGGDGWSDQPAEPGQRPRTAGPAAAAEADGEPTALRPASGVLLGTPVYDGDFADPYVLRVGDAAYAYATNTAEANVPVIVATASPIARYVGDVLPDLPSWSEEGRVWAPAVLALDDGYVLYYSTRVRGTGTQCVSRATSDSPTGPFVDDSAGPMVCQQELGGTIDPSVVTDRDGLSWLLFKNDGNCCGIPTSIWIQQLAPDGLSVVGEPVELLTAGPEWEGGLIEGPSMVLDGDRVLLFYSGNAWDTENYAIGYAVCESVTGPCRRPEAVEDAPWMQNTTFARGPGGQEFFAALGDVWMVYHGWARGQAGRPGAERRLYLDVVRLDDGTPVRVGSRGATTLALVVVGAAGVAIALSVWAWWRWRRRRRPA